MLHIKQLSKKVAVVGPLPPIKSGIARHTAAVVDALLADPRTEVKVWSFKRQYPQWLYPGGPERDQSLIPPAFSYNETLDALNPVSWFLVARAIRKFSPEILVSPAWTFVTAASLGYISHALRKIGVRSNVVVHNVEDHEHSRWKSALLRTQLANADRFVTHSQAMAKSLSDQFPTTASFVYPHPTFDDLPLPSKKLSRDRNLELLFFGIIRQYKGLDLLLQAISQCKRHDLRLTVAGQFWQNESETLELIEKLGISDRVEMRSGFIEDVEAADLFERADAVVLPYRSVTGSGVVATAFRYGRPVIASRLPGFSEVINDGETGWLVSKNSVDELSSCIQSLTRDQTENAGRKAKSFGENITWAKFAEFLV